MSEQTNAAAERSAHVTRGSSVVPAEWPVVQLPDGTWQLKSVAERDAEIEKLRAALKTARRNALKEAAQMASNRAAAWAEDAIGKFLETKWDYESRAEAGEEIASAILARAALGEK